MPPSSILLFPLIGQSNMHGAGLIEDLPATGFPAFASKLWNYKLDGTWQNPAQDPLHDITGAVYPVLIGTNSGSVGPGLSFADELCRRTGRDIGLIPCAVGGTSITQWQRPAGGVDTSTMYGASRARWEAAVSSSGGTIGGVFIDQGGAETNTSEEADSWPGLFAQLCADLRSDIGNTNLPIVFGKIGPDPDDPTRPAWGELQSNQSHIVNAGRTAMVDNGDATMIAENLFHFDTASQLRFGQRASDLMWILGVG